MRHVTSGTVYVDLEMQLIDPARTPPSASACSMHTETIPNSLIGEDIFVEDVEMLPTITSDGFRNTARTFVEQNRASFSSKDTLLAVLGGIPGALKEFSHHVPGLGAVLNSSYFADDIRFLLRLRDRMIFTKEIIEDYFEDAWTKHLVSFDTSVTINRVLENTLLYTVSQLERRYNKQANLIIGRAFQVMGSSLTFAGLFTKGATVPLGLVIGGLGTAVKARFAVRSAYNYIQRKRDGTLSVNREAHARHLYGLTLLHLLHSGKHDGNYVGSQEARKSVQFAQEVNPNHRDEEDVAAEFVSSVEGLNYIGSEAPTQTQIDHFLEYGLWSIMLGIKS